MAHFLQLSEFKELLTNGKWLGDGRNNSGILMGKERVLKGIFSGDSDKFVASLIKFEEAELNSLQSDLENHNLHALLSKLPRTLQDCFLNHFVPNAADPSKTKLIDIVFSFIEVTE